MHSESCVVFCWQGPKEKKAMKEPPGAKIQKEMQPWHHRSSPHTPFCSNLHSFKSSDLFLAKRQHSMFFHSWDFHSVQCVLSKTSFYYENNCTDMWWKEIIWISFFNYPYTKWFKRWVWLHKTMINQSTEEEKQLVQLVAKS